VNLPEFLRAKQVKVFFGQAELIAIGTRVAGTLFIQRLCWRRSTRCRRGLRLALGGLFLDSATGAITRLHMPPIEGITRHPQ